jgi:hypothetical protein
MLFQSPAVAGASETTGIHTKSDGADGVVAAKLNRDLAHTLLDALLKNPEADLDALAPKSYRSQMWRRKPLPETKIRRSKMTILKEMAFAKILHTLVAEPSSHILGAFILEYDAKRISLQSSQQNSEKMPKKLSQSQDLSHTLRTDLRQGRMTT